LFQIFTKIWKMPALVLADALVEQKKKE